MLLALHRLPAATCTASLSLRVAAGTPSDVPDTVLGSLGRHGPVCAIGAATGGDSG